MKLCNRAALANTILNEASIILIKGNVVSSIHLKLLFFVKKIK